MLGMGETDAEVLQTLKGATVVLIMGYSLICLTIYRLTDSWRGLCDSGPVHAAN